ncbi:MAG: NAD-dependent epimerase/dehydratase family protein, partial [Mariprofundaceae bacterium]
MTALVTGATGFVGSAVLRALLARGWPVRALARVGSDMANLDGLEVEVVHGDLNDPASLQKAVAGCDSLFHVAADYRLWTPDPEAMYRVNLDGTRALMQAAGEAGVSRIVYTSSVATIGLHADGAPADEQTPASLEDMIGHYKRSKYLAEVEVRKMTCEQGLPAVIVNPS